MHLTPNLWQDHAFRQKIREILSLSTLKKKYVDRLLDESGMRLYQQAFTHSSASDVNYEWLEIMGDATLNKCIVYYINHRFPQLQNAGGVKVIARLKINLVSKSHFSEIAERLGFLPFLQFNEETIAAQVAAHIKTKPFHLQNVLEDVLEAFFGATELLIDKMIAPGAGYGICYHLLKNIMDPLPISLKYEDLYDPITRLKETFDIYRTQLWGQVRYESARKDAIQHVIAYQYDPMTGRKQFLASADASILDEARQKAAILAIEVLAKRGFRRPIPDYYHSIADQSSLINSS